MSFNRFEKIAFESLTFFHIQHMQMGINLSLTVAIKFEFENLGGIELKRKFWLNPKLKGPAFFSIATFPTVFNIISRLPFHRAHNIWKIIGQHDLIFGSIPWACSLEATAISVTRSPPLKTIAATYEL